MMSKLHWEVGGSATLLSIAFALISESSGCLPTDTRAPPAEITVTATGSAATQGTITTIDGWTIQFERLLVTLGNVSLSESDTCTPYGEADYRRIFDAKRAKNEKVGLVYGLGTCGFQFRVSNPDQNSLLTAGVTEADKTLLRTPTTVTGVDAGTTQPTGISVLAKGKATKSGKLKSFSWIFQTRRLSYRECFSTKDSPAIQLSLVGEAALKLDIQLHGEALFQDSLDPEKARLWFDPYAAADDKGNGDGEVTLEELSKVTLTSIGIAPSDLDPPSDAGPPADTGPEVGPDGKVIERTMFDWLNQGLFPRLPRLSDKGTCTPSTNRGR